MPACPQCGEENPDRARFCWSCGAALVERPSHRAEERKVLSILFVDLVGFTARSDRADPEDVRATLRPYHARLKQEIEHFGGTVEKFIGDAVMAVFGAPVAHEDDAERAVRSGLKILEAIEDLNDAGGVELAIRAGVATGEAVVSLEARPEMGEGIATGDVVNTAARLQQSAPVGAAVVGESTFRATRDVILYEELEPVTVKGKSEPVAIWRATRPRGRFGVDVERRADVPFVGRQHELTLLKDAYVRALDESSLQLVTMTGEPGVGKTRLIAEFSRFVDDRPEIVWWRQGRCLPYGEGITFWALGEVVKAHVGILESDAPEEVEAKLAAGIETLVEDESDRDWFRTRLAPLIGAHGSDAAITREELFSAWQRFLELIAAQRPLVLVIEDLHWADTALVDFLEHLVDWASDVPLVLLIAARPELYERHAGWGGGKRNSVTISLGPLSDDETARLVASLIGRSVIPAEMQTALLERAGGNPLYAEEFVRMLAERGAPDPDVPLPETVQALIAARLDTLPGTQVSFAGRCSRRQSVLDRRRCRTWRRRRARCQGRHARAHSEGARAPRSVIVGGRPGGAGVLARARSADPARGARREAQRARTPSSATGAVPGTRPVSTRRRRSSTGSESSCLRRPRKSRAPRGARNNRPARRASRGSTDPAS